MASGTRTGCGPARRRLRVRLAVDPLPQKELGLPAWSIDHPTLLVPTKSMPADELTAKGRDLSLLSWPRERRVPAPQVGHRWLLPLGQAVACPECRGASMNHSRDQLALGWRRCAGRPFWPDRRQCGQLFWRWARLVPTAGDPVPQPDVRVPGRQRRSRRLRSHPRRRHVPGDRRSERRGQDDARQAALPVI